MRRPHRSPRRSARVRGRRRRASRRGRPACRRRRRGRRRRDDRATAPSARKRSALPGPYSGAKRRATRARARSSSRPPPRASASPPAGTAPSKREQVAPVAHGRSAFTTSTGPPPAAIAASSRRATAAPWPPPGSSTHRACAGARCAPRARRGTSGRRPRPRRARRPASRERAPARVSRWSRPSRLLPSAPAEGDDHRRHRRGHYRRGYVAARRLADRLQVGAFRSSTRRSANFSSHPHDRTRSVQRDPDDQRSANRNQCLPPRRGVRTSIRAPRSRSSAGCARRRRPASSMAAARKQQPRSPWRGKTFGFTNNFDPTGEYLGDAFGIYRACSSDARRLQPRPGSSRKRVVPDIATTVPKPTDGGKTYTFHLKPGVTFGPPVNREVTSKDVRYAFERLARPKNGAQYGFYYSVIRAPEYGAGKAKKISGISTPDAQHDRLPARPAHGRFPLPAGDAGGRPDPGRGRRLLRKQARRVRAQRRLDRPVHVRGVGQARRVLLLEAEAGRGVPTRRVHAGSSATRATRARRTPGRRARTCRTSSSSPSTPTSTTSWTRSRRVSWRTNAVSFRRRRSGSTRRATASRSSSRSNSGDQTWYVTMNLTQPPFDDIHVRKAMNWVMDKAALCRPGAGR